MNLFAKLDALEVAPTQNISSDDQAAINAIQEQHETEVLELEKLSSLLADFNAEARWAKHETSMFQSRIESQVRDANKLLPTSVIEHFNQAHNLNLSYHTYSEVSTEEDRLNPTHTINWILSQLEGSSFHGKAVQLLKERARSRLGRSKLKNTLLTIQNFVYPKEEYGGSLRLDGYSSNNQEAFTLLADALTHAHNPAAANAEEGGPLRSALMGICRELSGHRNNSDAWGETRPVNDANVENFVLYKNGNLRLRFTSPKAAQRFTTLYNLTLN